MNARLSTLLVAGGIFLAASPARPDETATPEASAVIKVATLLAARLDLAGTHTVQFCLTLPGFVGVPGVQVLDNPSRVVVDLPGVLRGTAVQARDLASLVHPLILKRRIAQFVVEPNPVTRVVLEVAAGTKVDVVSLRDEVRLVLRAGQGQVAARFTPTQAEPPVPQASPVVAMAQTQVQAEAPRPQAAVAIPPPEPVPTAEARVHAPELGLPGATAAARPDWALPAAPKAAALRTVPAIGMSFQALPTLAEATLAPALPAQPQEKPVVAPQEEYIRSAKTLGAPAKKYTGAPITLDIQNSDLSSLLRMLADAANMNFIADPDVDKIQVNFNFKAAPWDQLLDLVCKQYGLGYTLDNGIIRVAKVQKLRAEEEETKQLDEARALTGELVTRTRPLSYSKAADVKALVEKLMSPRGKLNLDERTNTLFITDLPKFMPVIMDLLNTLDVAIQQVTIEAKIVEATLGFQQAFGVRWPTNNAGDAKLTINGAAAPWVSDNGPSWNGVNNRNTGGNSATVAFAPGKDGATSIPAPAGELWLSFLSPRFNLNVMLQAAQSEGKLKIVSEPRVTMFNNTKGLIKSGTKIPYPSQQGGAAGGAITVAFVEANLQLEVTPQITSEGTIMMELRIEKAEADFSQQVNGTPSIITRSIDTKILVPDGGTAVLGGVYITQTSIDTAGVPFLSKIPVLGGLFRNKSNKDSSRELLIFVTPRISRVN
jgi:type IV pilus secretin PilQ/predicted competence protein